MLSPKLYLEFSIQLDTMLQGSEVLLYVCLYLKNFSANSADPDEMLHSGSSQRNHFVSKECYSLWPRL